MDQLIPVASKLQDVLGALGQNTTLNLPQIVVVGSQSSGKSSVLESLVGRSFLPRGNGIVTRRPLILQLYNTAGTAPPIDVVNNDDINTNGELLDGGNSSNSNDDGSQHSNLERGISKMSLGVTGKKQKDDSDPDEWGEFLHFPGKRFHSFIDIRDEITRETERLTGSGKSINPTPIHLKICSPRVLALTLVDLPGMARVAVGDQPHDIESQIREMAMRYVSNPNAIILAVSPANNDVACSDALQLANEVDPRGERTIGVLTKLDLMDPGTNASNVLRNQILPLRMGHIAIVGRGQKDVDSGSGVREGLKKEQNFFRTHSVYGNDSTLLARCGTLNLAKTLNSMLMHHVRECLPELKSRIISMTEDVQDELDSLGSGPMSRGALNRRAAAASEGTGTTDNSSPDELPFTDSEKGAALLQLLGKFSTNFGAAVEGRGNVGGVGWGRGGGAADDNDLIGGARVNYIFNDVFAASMTAVGAFDGLPDSEIRTTICNANGTRPSLFVPEISFDILVRRQISRLEQPGVQCVDLVYEELRRIASQCEPPELTRFPNLRDRMSTVMSNLLRRAVIPTQMMVSNIVKIELSYINTSHPDFIGGSRAVAQLMHKIDRDEKNAKDKSKKGKIEGRVKGQMNEEGDTFSDASESEGDISAPPTVKRRDNVSGENSGGTDQSSSSSNHPGIMGFIFGGASSARKSSLLPPQQRHVSPLRSKNISSSNPSRRELLSHIVQLPLMPDSVKRSDVPPTDREIRETEIIKSLIESYFGIVRKNFIDMVPKTVMYFLVNHVRDAVQNELVAELYGGDPAEMGLLMDEAEDVAQRRKTCIEMRALLTKALDIVNEVRDFSAT